MMGRASEKGNNRVPALYKPERLRVCKSRRKLPGTTFLSILL